MRQVASAPKGPQTLLQPDLAKQIILPDPVQVPTLMVWAHNKAVVKTIVAPPPAKPTSANVTPSPAPPTQEVNLADVSIATSQIPHPKLAALPSTTSPIAVPGPEVQLAPTSDLTSIRKANAGRCHVALRCSHGARHRCAAAGQRVGSFEVAGPACSRRGARFRSGYGQSRWQRRIG